MTQYRVTAHPRLRVRAGQGTHFAILDHLPFGAWVEVQEVKSGWAKLTRQFQDAQGRKVAGFVSADYLASTTALKVGVNIDPHNPVSRVPMSTLRPLHYARFAYAAQTREVEDQFSLYDAVVSDCANNGVTPIIVLTHQTWGEGRGYDWTRMTNDVDAWRGFTTQWLPAVLKVVQRYRDFPIIWQVWNEGDSASEAAVGLPAEAYAHMLDVTVPSIRRVSPTAQVISQGHVSGKLPYWQSVMRFSSAARQLNGLALHPYGVSGQRGGAFGIHGNVVDFVRTWRTITALPLYFTEFGLCGGSAPNLPETTVAGYAAQFLNACAAQNVAGAMWYGYATGMHNCRGALHYGQRGALWNTLAQFAEAAR